MEPLIGGLLSGGGSLLGNIFSADTSSQNVDKQLAFAEGQQQWQTQMSNTAYQRASADMKAAGLNPMMMFGSGGPASTPGQIAAPNFSARQSPLANLGNVVGSAVSSASQLGSLANTIANTDLTKQTTETERQNTIDAGNRAEASGLALNQKRLESLEAGHRLNLPKEDISGHATAEYKYGHYGEMFAKPFGSVVRGLNEYVDRAVEGITGPTGQAMWKRAQDILSKVPADIRQGGSDMYEDFRKIRGTTLNNDWR